jgi:thiol-disulfide isomerase/thioredoxin
MIELKSNTLKQYLQTSPKVILIFGAEWCPVCQILTEKIKIIEKNSNEYKFLYVDGDKFELLADSYYIEKYPTMVKYINGREVERKEGSNIKKLIN